MSRSRLMGWTVIAVIAVVLSPIVLAPMTMRFGEGTVFFGHPYAVMKQILFGFHRLPLWDPYLGGGDSLIGSPQAGLFYPPAWLVWLAPTVHAGLRLVVYLHLVAAAGGGYLLARWLGCPPVAAVLAPVGLLLNARMLHFIQGGGVPELYALPWAVWGIACLWRGTTEHRPGFLVAAGACLAAQVLAGTTYLMHGTALAYGLLLAGAALIEPVKRWRPRLAQLFRHGLAVVVVAAGLAAIKLLPVLESTVLSTRAGWTVDDLERTGQNPSWPDLGRAVGQFFGYLPPAWSLWVNGIYLGFAAVACVTAFRTEGWRARLTFLMMAFIACWAAMGPAVPVDLFAGLYYLLPGFRYSNYTGRVLFVFRLALPVLAALGAAWVFRALANARSRRFVAVRWAAVAGIAFCVGAAAAPFYHVLRRHDFGHVRPMPPTAASADAGSLGEALRRYDAQGQHPDDWNLRLGVVARWPSAQPFRVYHDGGRLPQITPYSTFLQGIELVMPLDPAYLPRYGLIVHYHDRDDLEEMGRLFTLFRLMNVRYLLMPSDHLVRHPAHTRLVYARPDAELHELTTCLPRVWIPDEAALLVGSDDAPDYNAVEAKLVVYHRAFDPTRWAVFSTSPARLDGFTVEELAPFRAVFLTRPGVREVADAQRLLTAYRGSGGQVIPLFVAGFRYTIPYVTANSMLDRIFPAKSLSPDSAAVVDTLLRSPRATDATLPATVAVERATPGYWRLRVETERPVTPVVVSETHFPGWHARVDNHPVPLDMANGLIRGVLVQGTGRHTVELWYAPVTLRIGAVVTAITVLGIAVWWRRRRRAA
ncbi:MAG: hypothetical protein HY600_02150 [Candidatus Omnitrophica bacterium]|nr:hypothetical protein [Candidatus Omnitrophota bacterium]